MRFRTALSLATMFVLSLAAVSLAAPIPEGLVPASLLPNPDNQSQIARLHWAEPYLHGWPLRHVLDTLKLALQLSCASKPKISAPGRLDCGSQFEV